LGHEGDAVRIAFAIRRHNRVDLPRRRANCGEWATCTAWLAAFSSKPS
jgi:hypothetical protein